MKEHFNQDYYHWYNQEQSLRLKFPSETVIGFLSKNFPNKGKILDLGCGSGRHVVVSRQLGFESYGLDSSDYGFEFCKKWALENQLDVNLIQSDMVKTPFEDSNFDGVICISAINGNSLQRIQNIINEIYRILKPNGKLLINFYGTKDELYNENKAHGKEIENNTFVIPGKHFHPDAQTKVPDYLSHFSSENEIQDLLKSFSKVRIYDKYLPFGNGDLSDNYRASHLIYALAEK